MAVQYVCAPNRKAAHIRSALNELPDNLAGVYEMLLSRIEGEVPGNKVLAIKTITWLLTAEKSLPTFILIHAVCMNSTERPEETSPDDILYACHHLVTLNKLTDRFEFGHFSVVEFLMTKRDMFDPAHSHAVLAETCLDTFYNIEFGQHKPPQDSLEAYATLFWAVHCQKSASVRTAEGSYLKHRFLSFIGNRGDKTAFDIWSKALIQTIDQLDWFNSLKDKWYESLVMAKDSDEQLCAISLVVGAFDFSEVVPMITGEDYDGLDVLNQHGRCSLHLTAIYGHEETLDQILAARKLDVNAKDDEGMAPLSWAVQSKNSTVVTRLLATDGLDANSVDNRGRTALSWAARQDQEEATRLLLQTNNIELNLKDESGRTPLMLAVQNGQVGALRQLLSKEGVDVNCRDKLDWTPLSFSAEGGHETIVKELLEAEGINVNCTDYDGWTPLIFAACEGHEEITRLLLAKSADVNATEDHGRSPLWFAARGGFEGIVRLLLRVDGIDVIAMDNLGRTPLLWAVEKRLEGIARPLLEAEGARLDPGSLDWDLLAQAAQKGHEAVVELFCDGRANPDILDNSNDWHLVLKPEDVNTRERSGFTPLIRAVSRNEGPLTSYLLSFPNIELNSTDQGGRTALAWAAREGHEKIIDLLLDAQGIDVNAKDNGHRTALQFAAQENHAGSVSRLLAYPTTDPNPRDYNGLTPLSWAAMKGHEDVVGLLLATNGIEADTKDNHGLTPLSWAAREGRENVVRRIVQVEGVDVNCRDKDGVSPLAWAASRGHESVVAVLLATRRVLIGARDDDGRTALDRATEGEHNKVAELLQRAGEGEVELVTPLGSLTGQA
jgi:ankyrin repeat protein